MIYVRDWRREPEPVGEVKKALKQAIGDWIAQEKMLDETTNTSGGDLDIDAVRLLNQFGKPTLQ